MVSFSSNELFVTSDQHFYHDNIRRYSNRPFSSVEEMNKALIDNWNSVVSPKHTVLTLGDFTFNKHKLGEIRNQLNGRILLVMGNHDKKCLRGLNLRNYFDSVCDYMEFNIRFPTYRQFVVASHYAFHVWNRSHYGSWDLHGHSHGTLDPDYGKKRCDVGVDPWKYKPVSCAELETFMASRTTIPVDQHGRRDFDHDHEQGSEEI